MADEFPGSGLVSAGIKIDPRAIVAPTVSTAQDCSGRVSTHWFGQFGQRGLCTHTPPVDLVGKVGDIFPGSTSIFALEDREIGWAMS